MVGLMDATVHGVLVAAALRRAAVTWTSRAFLGPLVRPGAVCLDLGAGSGLDTWRLSALAGRHGQVHSVEPLRVRARWMLSLTARLGCANVVVHRAARGGPTEPGPGGPGPQSGSRHLYVIGGTAAPAIGTGGRPAGLTVDRLCRQAGLERVDLIKVVVGRVEPDVLLGAFGILLRDRPSLLLELELDRTKRSTGYQPEPTGLVRSLTTTLGYRMYRWKRGGWQTVSTMTDDCRSYLFSVRAPSGAAR
ncbi:hypothetical protein [Streptomyces sp. NRRL S-495]|uniref:hypothetical protein n=1 Tax=Streptomyces sp. NRRL S-495 TaxID=1609133 RepID=UPI0006983102|nr:hypothetical protein [Streptomyces sp. NRRL S-495]